MVDGLTALYVEDDPALRGLLSEALSEDPRVAQVVVAGTPREAFDAARHVRVDVALLDLSLGLGRPNGIDVGIALRGIIPRIPIVLFSQHRVPRVEAAVPLEHRVGWSFLDKGAGVDPARVVDVLAEAIAGTVSMELSRATRPADDVLLQLTWRQREIMALAASGYDAIGIAERLHLAHITVRKELSRAYRVLVPDPPPSTDLRTAAVLEFLRLTSADVVEV